MIEVCNLKLKKKNLLILDDISLNLKPGRVSLFLGKSGAGKTTILRCIAQLEKEYFGQIQFEGKDLRSMDHKERCQHIGFVPQSYALFPFLTVLDNCAHPLRKILGLSKEEAYAQVEDTLAKFDMQKLLHCYPFAISGGQQQRTAIVRALLLNPLFLLLDEPTSALDPLNTNLLIDFIRQLKEEGKGIVISSQDMAFAQKIKEDVYFLENGKVVEQVRDGPLDDSPKLAEFLFVDSTV